MYFLGFCLFVVVISNGVNSKECSDCMNYDQCPDALDLARNERTDATIQLFKRALCGPDTGNKASVPKVCCSDFSHNTIDPGVPEDSAIANHVNLKLLSSDCGTVKGDRIFGGELADMYEFPWMALISHQTRVGRKFNCGGTIINKRYVLTAAHCVQNKVIAGVRLGEYDRNEVVDCQKGVCEEHLQNLKVEKEVVHEGYQSAPKISNDIALLRLAKDIDFNHKNIHQICLPITDDLRRQGLGNRFATAAGWGITESLRTSNILRKVKVPIRTTEECSSLYNRFAKQGEADATADKLCAGSENKDSCNGDSGGPLMMEQKINNVDRYVQYGVVSHGPQMCGSDFPGVYTDLRKYIHWILDNIEP